MERTSKKHIKEKPKPLNFHYAFEESIDNVTMATVVKELVKHLLFMKDQIPMPVDLLKCTYKQTDETHVRKNRPSTLKKLKFVDNLNSVLDSLKMCFTLYKVQKVAMLLGSTVVSPKETFLILCETELLNGDTIDNGVVRKLMRTIVTSDQLNEHIYGIPAQNVHILISLKEPFSLTPETNTFCPKTNFVLPQKGKTHVFNFGYRSIINECDSEGTLLGLNEKDESEDYWYSAVLPLKGFKEVSR